MFTPGAPAGTVVEQEVMAARARACVCVWCSRLSDWVGWERGRGASPKENRGHYLEKGGRDASQVKQ